MMKMIKAKCFNLYDVYYGDIFIARFPKKEAIEFIKRSHRLIGMGGL